MYKTQLQYYVFVMKPILYQLCPLRFLANLEIIHNNNFYADIIFFCIRPSIAR